MMMDFNALAEGRDNHITAMSLARLYKHILNVVIEMLMAEKWEYLRSPTIP